MAGPGLTEYDLYQFKQMASGKYGPQWTAIRKLVDEVRQQRKELLETKPAGTIRNADLDNVLLASTEMHKSLTFLLSKLRPIPIEEAMSLRPNTEPIATAATPVQSSTQPRKVFSIPEVSEMLGVSRSKIYGLIQKGDLKSILIGKRRLVPEIAVDELITALGMNS